ncbi:MAG TPA: hypothetical protein VLT36_00345 [Candidatus Dormibacteraeota bacterium]|nr:hypothetical protein [Candidatus Dormibacteraeota bacterium]
MIKSTLKACMLGTLLVTFLSGCIHVHKEKVVEPAPAVVTPAP